MREEGLDAYEATLASHLARNDPAAAAAFAAASPEQRAEACAIVQEKAQIVTEIWPLIAFLFTEPAPDEDAWAKVMKPGVVEPLAAGLEVLEGLPAGSWSAAGLEPPLRGLMEARGIGARKLLQPIRVAISGSSISPGIFESLSALCRERSLERIRAALDRLKERD